MGVEDRIRGLSKPSRTEKRQTEQDAREFAEEVLQILRDSEDKIIQGKTENDAQRLAAILSFIRGQVTERMVMTHSYPVIHRADDPKQRLALEAGQMIYDIVHQHRHPVHTFFRGLLNEKLQPRQKPRRDVYRWAILMTCALRLEEVNAEKRWPRIRAIREMRNNPVIVEHVPSEQWLTNVITQNADKTEPDYKGIIQDLRRRLKAAKADTTEAIIGWTAANLQFSQDPLDLGAATEVERRAVVSIPRDGSAPVLLVPDSGVIPVTIQPQRDGEAVSLRLGPPPESDGATEP